MVFLLLWLNHFLIINFFKKSQKIFTDTVRQKLFESFKKNKKMTFLGKNSNYDIIDILRKLIY